MSTTMLLKNKQPKEKYYLSATVDETVVKGLDSIKGMAPRSRLIEKALGEYLDREIGSDSWRNNKS